MIIKHYTTVNVLEKTASELRKIAKKRNIKFCDFLEAILLTYLENPNNERVEENLKKVLQKREESEKKYKWSRDFKHGKKYDKYILGDKK